MTRSDRIAGDGEAVGAEGLDGGQQVFAVARFDDNLKNRTFGGQVRKDALVEDFDDVGLGFGEDGRDTGKLAGAVLQVNDEL